ncbi:MAG: hypothetical protein QOE28_1650, partial [Solirubrobacteraceae bacterium]|nr:hypothetical protein [Solirubrobacteraceae bacterium]
MNRGDTRPRPRRGGPRRGARRALAATALAGAAVGAYATLVEPRRLVVERRALELPHWPPA